MSKHILPRITPQMFRDFPDQTCDILNQLIDIVNGLESD